MNVLIADDSSITRHLLRGCLRSWNFECSEVVDGPSALKALLGTASPRIAILDWHMPGLDGPAVCRQLRAASSDQRYCYVIMLTGMSDRHSMLQALEAGVDDFITKPFDEAELKQRLRSGQRIIDLQDRLVAVQEALMIQATRDPLTGCWNRAAIVETLETGLAQAAQQNTAYGILLLDIDNFKQVNDRYGHQAGDEVLRQMVGRLQMELRPQHCLGRYGGEEFLVTLPGARSAEVARVGDLLRQAARRSPMHAYGHELQVTVSLGAACTDTLGSFDPQTLIRAADVALYSAKNSGRDCFHVSLGDTQPSLAWDGESCPVAAFT